MNTPTPASNACTRLQENLQSPPRSTPPMPSLLSCLHHGLWHLRRERTLARHEVREAEIRARGTQVFLARIEDEHKRVKRCAEILVREFTERERHASVPMSVLVINMLVREVPGLTRYLEESLPIEKACPKVLRVDWSWWRYMRPLADRFMKDLERESSTKEKEGDDGRKSERKWFDWPKLPSGKKDSGWRELVFITCDLVCRNEIDRPY
ncbi:hypothetical protein BJY01DRAFT_254131 [Aspergillus pseudoustus]|uniref:Uncharacterized protein n=1 Tax=Aspergillus pseudoustus TaxID=1810923 RepID=A0ABR4IVR5_9EURO